MPNLIEKFDNFCWKIQGGDAAKERWMQTTMGRVLARSNKRGKQLQLVMKTSVGRNAPNGRATAYSEGSDRMISYRMPDGTEVQIGESEYVELLDAYNKGGEVDPQIVEALAKQVREV